MTASVVLASNRGPLGFRRAADGTVVAGRGGGGLVSAMAGLAADPDVLWVCAALSEVDREVAAAAPHGRLDLAGHPNAGAVAMLAIDPATFDAAYNRVANATLWFVHHEMLDPPPDVGASWRRDWSAYVTYNVAFADAIAAAAAPDARVLVQDYHLALLPALLRARRPEVRIAHFTHTPWASPAAFATLPDDVAADVLIGMLGADSLGFHSPRWAGEFAACCAAVPGAVHDGDTIRYDGRRTRLHVHPLGVAAEPLRERAAEPDVTERRAAIRAAVGERTVVARVDRTEPSKNIVGGLLAFRELLVRHPEHRGRVVHLALAYPSRQEVAAYRDYTELCRATAAAVNAELGTAQWTPVRLEIRDDFAQSLATMQVADVMLVNPVRDGMNLVAKEAMLLGEQPVLVLSECAGAADEMSDGALLVDPHDLPATAEALHRALTMSADERSRRHRELVRVATALAPREWLQRQLDDL